jgi:hypothetical protein
MLTKNKLFKRVIFSLFFLSILFNSNSLLTKSIVSQNLILPSNWVGCNGVTGNVNNDLPNVRKGSVIDGFWNALVGMGLGQTKSFVIPVDQHPYSDPLDPNYNPELATDLFYIVRIESVNAGSTVLSTSVVDVFYSLYTDCTDTNIATTSTGIGPSTTSTPPADNTMLMIAGLGVVVIGGGVLGYFTVLKPRLELPQDTAKLDQKQAKKRMSQAKELLDIIQDKKEVNNTTQISKNPTKPKTGSRPRRR